MNREEFISKLQESLKDHFDLSKANLGVIINEYHNLIMNTVSEGDRIQFIGFGSWSVSERKETDGRNPKTGLKIKIAARKQPKFTAGSGFKDAVNGRAKATTKKAPAKKTATSTDNKKKKTK